MPKSDAERKQDQRDRDKQFGLVRWEIKIRPKDKPIVKELLDKLNKKYE